MTIEFIPHKYQEKAIDFMVANHKTALFMDPGLGKTAVTLTAIRHFKKRTLIVAPLDICYRAWPREIRKWEFSHKIKFTILHGPKKEARFLANHGIYLINPEGLRWFSSMITKHKRWIWDILVVDESLTFQNHQSKRFTYLAEILSNFSHRYILNGTPIPRSYLQLWGQYYLLDKGLRLKSSYWGYRNSFFYATDYKRYNWQLLPGQEEEIKMRVADITYRASGEDHLDLPKRVLNDIVLTMPKKARKHYAEMMRKLRSEFELGTVKAANAGVKSQKLHCIANGFVYISKTDFKTGKSIRLGEEIIHDTKLDALEHLINELSGRPLLVGYYFNHDLEMLLSRFPDTPSFSSGKTQREKYFIEKRWNEGKIPFLFAQIDATARGLNLQEAGNHIAFYSMTANYYMYDQFIKRVERQGQKEDHVIVHRLLMENTVDDKVIIPKLKERGDRQDFFLKLLRDHTMGEEAL